MDSTEPRPDAAPAVTPKLVLAGVRRTLEWALLDSERLTRAPYLGRGCAVQVRALAKRAGETDDHDGLLKLADALVALDGDADAAARHVAVTTVVAQLDAWVPLSAVGLRAVALEERGVLVEPKRSRRKRKNKGEGSRDKDASSAETPQQAEEQASPSEAASAAPSEEPASPPEETGKRSRSRRDGKKRRKSPPPEEAPAEEPPPTPPRRLPFGHPDGTGRSLTELDGADPQLVAELTEAGIETVADLLLTPPSGFHRAQRASLPPDTDEPVMVRGRVVARRVVLTPGLRRLELLLETRSGQTVACRWVLGAPRGWDGWAHGTDLAMVGVLVEDEDGLRMVEAEPVGLDGRGSGLMPRYDIDDLDDLDSAAMRTLVARCLADLLDALEDWLPSHIRDAHKVLPLDEALRDAHFPGNAEGRGRGRLAFEKLLLLQLGVGWRTSLEAAQRGVAHKALHKGVGQLGSEHNIRLDDAQEQAFSEIRRDLLRPSPMNRLLQGDVGAGKGIVALMSAIVVAENGQQVAMVSPDALAAERRYLHAEALLRSLAIVPLLVTDAPDRAATDAIGRGAAHVVFGTPALLEQDVRWKRLGLVVAEERPPYGGLGRDQLAHLSNPPDLLVITRAPIPASLVFTVFGGFEISIVASEDPPRVATMVHAADERAEVYRQAREAVAQGRQAFVVFPVREGRDLLSRKDAMRMAKALQAEAFAGARIGVYSSEMSREERSRVFDDFQHRRVDVLVCTTYIEDAPSVANATRMVVEYADLHDMVRLHRLRGHVGQGWTDGAAHFILSDDPTDDDRKRVESVVQHRDGFKLAEIDLEMRGTEALLGDRAGEVPELCWSQPSRDRGLLLKARAEAFRLLHQDPGLRRSKPVARAVRHRWGDWLDAVFPAPDYQRLGAQENRTRRRRRRRRRR